MRYLAIAVFLVGCPTAAYAPVAAKALDTFLTILEENAAEENAVINCEHEIHPSSDDKPGQVLMLCTAELPAAR